MKYLVILEGTDGSYGAYSPDIPGYLAAGDTREETVEPMREAIVFHLDGMMEDGEQIPHPSSTAEYVAA
jgi:predicted RNase H-like HicB family nuclease